MDSSIAPNGEKKLSNPGGAEGSVRKITMIEAGDRKHPDIIKGNRDGDRGPAPAYPNDSQTHQMYGKEGNTANPVYLGRPLYFRVLKARPGIKPAKQ